MSAADELSKLGELKEKGLITAEEFNKQKATILETRPKRKDHLWLRVPLVGFVTILFGFTLYNAYNRGSSDTLPTCMSNNAVETLKNAFANSPGALTYHYMVVDVSSMKEMAYNKEAKNRTCSGKLSLNNADVLPVKYTLQGKPEGGYLLTYEADLAGELGNEAVSPEASVALNPSAVVTTGEVTETEEDPAIEACVQTATDKYRKEIGPDGMINSDQLDEWAENCKQEVKQKPTNLDVNLKKDQEYESAKTALLQSGWRPVQFKNPPFNELPEVHHCQQGGVGQCEIYLSDAANNYLDITTTNDGYVILKWSMVKSLPKD